MTAVPSAVRHRRFSPGDDRGRPTRFPCRSRLPHTAPQNLPRDVGSTRYVAQREQPTTG